MTWVDTALEDQRLRLTHRLGNFGYRGLLDALAADDHLWALEDRRDAVPALLNLPSRHWVTRLRTQVPR